MNYKSILFTGAITAWILSEMIPVAQIWAPATLVVMALLYAAQKVTA